MNTSARATSVPDHGGMPTMVGLGRNADNLKALVVYLDREPTDSELTQLYDELVMTGLARYVRPRTHAEVN